MVSGALRHHPPLIKGSAGLVFRWTISGAILSSGSFAVNVSIEPAHGALFKIHQFLANLSPRHRSLQVSMACRIVGESQAGRIFLFNPNVRMLGRCSGSGCDSGKQPAKDPAFDNQVVVRDAHVQPCLIIHEFWFANNL